MFNNNIKFYSLVVTKLHESDQTMAYPQVYVCM